MAIEALIAGIDEMAACDAFELEEPEVVVELFRQLSRFEAIVARASAAFDDSGAWRSDGAHTATAWLTVSCAVSKKVARRHLCRGKAMRHLDVAAAALAQGDINGAHLDALLKLVRPVTQEALARDEAMLVDQATQLTFAHFIRVLNYWEQMADPDGVERTEADKLDRRDTYLTRTLDGSWFGQMNFDPISGAIVHRAHERIEQELFEEDWAKAKAELGREPMFGELSRTPGQRRADAMVELATRALTAPANGRRPEPLFSVLVGYETFGGRILELAQRQAVTPGSLVPWLDRAWLERAVFAPAGRPGRGRRAHEALQRGHPAGH